MIKSFGENLRYLRLKVNLTQQEVADSLQISRQSISKWEQDIALPQINFIVPLTKILKCNLEELFYYELKKECDSDEINE